MFVAPTLLIVPLNAGKWQLLVMNAVPGRSAVTGDNPVRISCNCGLLRTGPAYVANFWYQVCGPCAKRVDQGSHCVYTGELEKKRAVRK